MNSGSVNKCAKGCSGIWASLSCAGRGGRREGKAGGSHAAGSQRPPPAPTGPPDAPVQPAGNAPCPGAAESRGGAAGRLHLSMSDAEIWGGGGETARLMGNVRLHDQGHYTADANAAALASLRQACPSAGAATARLQHHARKMTGASALHERGAPSPQTQAGSGPVARGLRGPEHQPFPGGACSRTPARLWVHGCVPSLFPGL